MRALINQAFLVSALTKGVYNQDSIKGIAKDLEDLEAWAKAMRAQCSDETQEINEDVLPSVGPWIGGILGKLATLKQIKI